MYELRIKSIFSASGRQLKNIGGRVVVFYDGVAKHVSEETAMMAKRKHYIDSVTAMKVENEEVDVVEDEVQEVVEEPVVEPVVEEEVEEIVDEEEVFEDYVSAEYIDETTEEAQDNKLTSEEITELYEQLGTWSAVAEYLDITTSTLRKYREELGIA